MMLDARTDTLLMDAVHFRTRENGYDEALRHHRPLPVCPLCRCWMSGDRDVPNVPTEACENLRCACHEEES